MKAWYTKSKFVLGFIQIEMNKEGKKWSGKAWDEVPDLWLQNGVSYCYVIIFFIVVATIIKIHFSATLARWSGFFSQAFEFHSIIITVVFFFFFFIWKIKYWPISPAATPKEFSSQIFYVSNLSSTLLSVIRIPICHQ